MNNSYWKTFWIQHAKYRCNDNLQSQVLRTLDKKPISEAQFYEILDHTQKMININSNDRLLDLCCGNGLFTTLFSTQCNMVIGVDFAKDLVSSINRSEYKNISIVVADVTDVKFKAKSFDKVVLYAGIQYMSYKETISLFENIGYWLRPNGLCFIGDIPDIEKVWTFFNTKDREQIYFDSLKNEVPIIGNWFNKVWLKKLGEYVKFKDINIIEQPENLPYSHYRFDMILRK